jgi:hypothetical protein
MEEIDSKDGELGDTRTIRIVKSPRNVNGVYWRPQEISSDTMLNIMWRVEEREREERVEGKNGLHCILFYILYMSI